MYNIFCVCCALWLGPASRAADTPVAVAVRSIHIVHMDACASVDPNPPPPPPPPPIPTTHHTPHHKQVCSALHQRYADFTNGLMAALPPVADGSQPASVAGATAEEEGKRRRQVGWLDGCVVSICGCGCVGERLLARQTALFDRGGVYIHISTRTAPRHPDPPNPNPPPPKTNTQKRWPACFWSCCSRAFTRTSPCSRGWCGRACPRRRRLVGRGRRGSPGIARSVLYIV